MADLILLFKKESHEGLTIRSFLLALILILPLHEGVRRMLISIKARLRLRLMLMFSSTKDPGNATVSAMYIHPVKSLRAVSVPKAVIDERGLKGDRRFMLVTPSPPPLFGTPDATHKFLTQRQAPALATVVAELNDDGTMLTISRGKESVTVDVGNMLVSKPKLTARVWSDIVDVVDVGDKAADFLQAVVPDLKGVRLVAMAGDRAIDETFTPSHARGWLGQTPQTSLNDGFPILVAFEASLEELNQRLKHKKKASIPMGRFRPNIVIRGTEPFEEDTWKLIQIGDGTILSFVKGCPRCKQSCTDQLTGQVYDEPVATLSEFRALGTNKEDVFFAQNAVPQSIRTTVCLGDTVRVLKRGKPVWDKASKDNL
jgi:uncharacterized protein YcbX